MVKQIFTHKIALLLLLCLLMMGGCFGVSTLMLLAQMLGRGFTIHL